MPRATVLISVLIACVAGCTGPGGEGAALATTGTGCPAGARCLPVLPNGAPDPGGTYTAQCTGRFADYVDSIPPGFSGRRFRLSQNYPSSPATAAGSYPWDGQDFRTAAEAVAYLTSVRNYVYEGMVAADWYLEDNAVRRWYHVPWMHTGRNPREFVRGLTQERPLTGPELGIRRGVTVQNWAVGFYNEVGAASIGATWADPRVPDAALAQAAVGTVVAKLLFSAAAPTDFEAGDILDGSAEWTANIHVAGGGADKVLRSVRLLQIDIAVRDARAGASGWVFGTFAYDHANPAPDPFARMVPVGLMWGNDPTLTLSEYRAGRRPVESIINPAAPGYALGHLGLAGRLNGPVDNPASSCLSCHSTAQTPVLAPMIAFSNCSETAALLWFRNLPGSQAFGGADSSTCQPQGGGPAPVALDYSLQQAVAFRNALSPSYHDPCLPGGVQPGASPAVAPPQPDSQRPRPLEYPVKRHD